MAKTIIIIEDTDATTSGVNVQVIKQEKLGEAPDADTPANRLATLVESCIHTIYAASVASKMGAPTVHPTVKH
jgi:hypothetical protein